MGKYITIHGASRGEFEALRRMSIYQELADGTLSRIDETGHEFRVYNEDIVPPGKYPLGVATAAWLAELRASYQAMLEEIKRRQALHPDVNPWELTDSH